MFFCKYQKLKVEIKFLDFEDKIGLFLIWSLNPLSIILVVSAFLQLKKTCKLEEFSKR